MIKNRRDEEDAEKEQPKLYYQGDVLVVESETVGDLNIIEVLREERIREHSNFLV